MPFGGEGDRKTGRVKENVKRNKCNRNKEEEECQVYLGKKSYIFCGGGGD
jgi:hypothetical protein